MVCNLVTYRARSAVREVGYALGFPRPLVDRVAKALETYDSVMVRRDLEADGGFAEFFRRPGDGSPAEVLAAERAEAHGLVDGMGQLQQRVPLVGKVPPWRAAAGAGRRGSGWPRRPFAWLGDDPLAPRTAVRGGGPSDDEGGPGDTPASVAWLRDGRGPATRRIATGSSRRRSSTAGGSIRSAASSSRRRARPDKLGRPTRWDPPRGAARAALDRSAPDRARAAAPAARRLARSG